MPDARAPQKRRGRVEAECGCHTRGSLRQHYLEQVQRVFCGPNAELSAFVLPPVRVELVGSPKGPTMGPCGGVVKTRTEPTIHARGGEGIPSSPAPSPRAMLWTCPPPSPNA